MSKRFLADGQYAFPHWGEYRTLSRVAYLTHKFSARVQGFKLECEKGH